MKSLIPERLLYVDKDGQILRYQHPNSLIPPFLDNFASWPKSEQKNERLINSTVIGISSFIFSLICFAIVLLSPDKKPDKGAETEIAKKDQRT